MSSAQLQNAARQHIDQVLQRLCGMRLDDLDHETSFLELGFDSLFLIQFAQRLKSQTGVKISLRQLIEELATISELVNFLADHMEPSIDTAQADEEAVPSSATETAVAGTTTAQNTAQETAPIPPDAFHGVSTPPGQTNQSGREFAAGEAASPGAPAASAGSPECLTPQHAAPQAASPSATGTDGSTATGTHWPVAAEQPPGARGDRAALAEIIAQQNELMRMQLQLLAGTSVGQRAQSIVPPAPAVAAAPTSPVPAAPVASAGATNKATAEPHQPPADAQPTAPRHGKASRKPRGAASPKPDYTQRFGPYKPVRKSPTGQLTDRQQQFLNSFIEDYARKTSGSRKLAQTHRPHFADPRGVAGYRRLWKSIVYQIAVDRSKGARIWDIDGNEYIDIAMGFGLNLFGHSPDFITRRLHEQLDRGVEIGPQCPLAGEVAQQLCSLARKDRATFCNTGSEAVMAAMRLARTVTGKPTVVYFNKDYHGNFDAVLMRAAKFGDRFVTQPAAPGVPENLSDTTLVLPYADPVSLEIIEQQADQIAAVLVEPVQSADPAVQPREFLHALRELTRRHDIALVMDEVITGFRAAAGGAQEYFDVWADMATYGKVLGGGMPIGALAGSSRFMDALDGGNWRYEDESEPTADMTFFAGTFVRHPLAIAAAHEVLMQVKENSPQLQQEITARTTRLVERLNRFFEKELFPIRVAQFSSLFRFMFPPDLEFAELLYFQLLHRGIFTRGWGDNCFLSTAHTDQDVDAIVDAVKESCLALRAGGFFPVPDPVPQQSQVVVASHTAVSSPPPAACTNASANNNAEPEGASATDAPSASSDAVNIGNAEASRSEELEPFPLTDMQQEILLTSAISPEAAAANNEPFALRLQGRIQLDQLIEAMQFVFNRHPALRLVIDKQNQTQRIGPRVQFPIHVHDLRSVSEEECERRFDELSKALASTCVDPSRDPLVRVEIIRNSDQVTTVLLDGHHIASDGWSWNVLLEEIAAVYSARCKGASIELPPPGDFRAWVLGDVQRRQEEQEALEYWADRFRGLPEPLELPTDRPRGKRQQYAADSIRVTLPADLSERLTEACARRRTNPSALFLGAFHILLARLSNQSDVVVGIRGALQALEENPRLVGLCMSVLPIRVEVAVEKPISTIVQEVAEEQWNALEHQRCHLGRIVRHLSPPRHPGRMPLTDVHFNYYRDSQDIQFEGLDHEIWITPKAAINHDLFFNVTDTGKQININVDFRRDLFDADTIAAWLEHYAAILQAWLEQPEQSVAQVNLFTPRQLAVLHQQWNGTQHDYPRNATVVDLFTQRALQDPKRVAVTDSSGELTYGELHRRAGRVASRLAAEGIGPGDYVGVLVDRSANMLVATLGILQTGAAYVPMDAEFPDERLEFMAQDAAIRVMLTVESMSQRPIAREVPRLLLERLLHDEAGESPDFTPAGPQSDDTAYVIYTSGSTGIPKGVRIPHRALTNFLLSMQRQPGCDSHDRLAAVTTLSFDIAALELYLPLISGARVHIVDTRDATDGFRLSRLLEEQDITILQATPATWRLLLEAGWQGKRDLKMLCGGEAMPGDLARELVPLGQQLWNMYGPTETTIWSTIKHIASPHAPVTIGRPIDNTQVYLLDAHDQLTPIRGIGRLFIAGDGLADGYLHRPELTQERFRTVEIPGPDGRRQVMVYDTGDLARWRTDGEIEFIGRADFQVKISGYRIELGEIEAVLSEHPDVAQAVAWVHEDALGHRNLVAYVKPQNPQLRVEAVQAYMKTKLPDYMVPAFTELVDAFPLTANGKIDRKHLPAPQPGKTAADRSRRPPQTPTERMVAELFADVLQVDGISAEDDFFELGGHSLSATRIIGRLAERLPIELTIADLFETPTVAGLAAQLDSRLGALESDDAPIPIAKREVRHIRRSGN